VKKISGEPVPPPLPEEKRTILRKEREKRKIIQRHITLE
jgi:hypothetical protein